MNNSIIMVESEMKLKLELENIVILSGNEYATYPLNKLDSIIIDNMNSSLTGRLLAKIAEMNVNLIVTNKNHLPIGMYFPYSNYSRSSKMLYKQIEFIKFNNYIWKDIVVNKIKNQSRVLFLLDYDNKYVEDLNNYASNVEIGDSTNKESFAAKVYFNGLMGSSFSRGNEDILLNSALDYGYAIIRSTISKIAVGCGLNMNLGIHHKNEYNDFNLSDDLIEPYRPIVDIYCYKLMYKALYFSSSHRKDIINILYKKIYYNDKNISIYDSIEQYVQSFAKLIKTNENNIEYPNVSNTEFANKDYIFDHYEDDYIFKEEYEDEL